MVLDIFLPSSQFLFSGSYSSDMASPEMLLEGDFHHNFGQHTAISARKEASLCTRRQEAEA